MGIRMDATTIETMFSTPAGAYAFARWNRPLAPVIFGVEAQSLPVLKGAFEAMAQLAGIGTVETDPEFGSNLMMFFVRDWSELGETPKLDQLVPDLGRVVERLTQADALQYRFFRYDEAGGIRAAFLFVRMSGAMADLPAETLALGQSVQAILTWGEDAFSKMSPLAVDPENGITILRPEIADLIRAGYDPVMPVAADDGAHALRLAARLGV